MTRIRFDGCDLSRALRHPGPPSVRTDAWGTTGSMAEQLTTPRELLAACLRQMLWIERELAYTVLPRLSEQAHTPDLRAGFDRHLLETEAHATTVRDVLGELGVPADPEEVPVEAGAQVRRVRLLAQPRQHGVRSEERRVGKEWRCRWGPGQ